MSTKRTLRAWWRRVVLVSFVVALLVLGIIVYSRVTDGPVTVPLGWWVDRDVPVCNATADVYRPLIGQAKGTALYVHGGYWVRDATARDPWLRQIASSLTADGYEVVLLHYRLHGGRAEQTADVACAGERWHPIAWGVSAGANLLARAATPGLFERVALVEGTYEEASPQLPPAIVIHGMTDDVFPWQSAEAYAERTGAEWVALPTGHQRSPGDWSVVSDFLLR